MSETGVLSDGTIRRLVADGRVVIDPWDPDMVQPASVDLRLGDSFRVFHNHLAPAIDLDRPPEHLTELIVIDPDKSFVIHPGEFVLGATLERVRLPDDVVARIEGKALDVETPVPTVAGWKTMGTLEVGDLVFDPDGRPVPVVAVTEEMVGRECREVAFSDGTTVIADVDHRWEVMTQDDRRRGKRRVLTTRELEGNLRRGKEYRYRTVQAAPIAYAAKDLPVDPYVLGAWIGDGTSTTAVLTSADPPVLEAVPAAGYGVAKTAGPLAYRIGGADHVRDPVTGRYAANGSLHSTLRALGLLGNKHIPEPYLTASVEQRQALLEGLMDTGGYVDTLGRCDITTIDYPLAKQYAELIASLGHRPTIATKTATLYGKACSLRHEVTFTPTAPVFRLPRKRLRQHLVRRQFVNRGRAVVDVAPFPSVPVRCVEVGSSRGAFLVTRSYIPTHNSSLGRLGLIVHATAGFVDPGFEGTLTLEITNLTRIPIILWPGKPIAQLSFMALDRPAERPYGHPELGSHYHGQVAATESRYEGGPAR
jgi:deoxycytidine triphosphate deaminase